MNKELLAEILEKHQLWLSEKEGGECANLIDANLSGADLRGADLWRANLSDAKLININLGDANLCGANLSWADVKGANLSGANLSGADLGGANLTNANLKGATLYGVHLDFSCLPLWCGGLHVKFGDEIMRQIAYHFCAQACNTPEYIAARNSILEYANGFHRADECGVLTPMETPDGENRDR